MQSIVFVQDNARTSPSVVSVSPTWQCFFICQNRHGRETTALHVHRDTISKRREVQDIIEIKGTDTLAESLT